MTTSDRTPCCPSGGGATWWSRSALREPGAGAAASSRDGIGARRAHWGRGHEDVSVEAQRPPAACRLPPPQFRRPPLVAPRDPLERPTVYGRTGLYGKHVAGEVPPESRRQELLAPFRDPLEGPTVYGRTGPYGKHVASEGYAEGQQRSTECSDSDGGYRRRPSGSVLHPARERAQRGTLGGLVPTSLLYPAQERYIRAGMTMPRATVSWPPAACRLRQRPPAACELYPPQFRLRR